jgi:DNA-binding MarR family transcriptional regulator
MRSRPETLEEFIWQLRRTFRDLTEVADRELGAMGIRAADRAFLEFLAREQEPVSLSQLARKYSLSRQHIQQTFRRLPHPEWVEWVTDPADRRAVLLRLSRKGKAAWKRIRDADRAFLGRVAGTLAEEEVRAGTELLQQLRRALAQTSEGGAK